MSLTRSFLWIILFGSLIGLNETLIGSFDMPYRSVILNSITIFLLTIGRFKIPRAWTSILIIAIAVLFKINSAGIQTCTVNWLLCGPTALLLIGISHEVFSSLFISKNSLKYLNYVMACSATAILAFSLFAVMDTFILKVWDVPRLMKFIFVKSILTAITSSAISIFGLYLVRTLNKDDFLKLNPYWVNGILSAMIIALWIFGSYVNL